MFRSTYRKLKGTKSKQIISGFWGTLQIWAMTPERVDFQQQSCKDNDYVLDLINPKESNDWSIHFWVSLSFGSCRTKNAVMTLFWSKLFYTCTVMTLFRHNTQPKCTTITLFPYMPLFRHQRVDRKLVKDLSLHKNALKTLSTWPRKTRMAWKLIFGVLTFLELLSKLFLNLNLLKVARDIS